MTWKHKIFGFSGRLRRRDYWLIVVGKFLISIAITLVVVAATGGKALNENPEQFSTLQIVQLLAAIPSFWVSIAITLKRCHDRNKGGGWVAFFWLVPIVGWIWGFVEVGCLDGTQGPNSYGKSPKGVGGDTTSELERVFA